MIELIIQTVAILGFLATVPGTLEILLVTSGALRRAKHHNHCAPRQCKLAIVIPAHNEVALIARCVQSVAASKADEKFEIVVVADNCTDETALRASEAGARVLTRLNVEQRGKGYALRMAFDHLMAEGFDAFLIIDADSEVSPNLVSASLARLNAGASGVQCRYRVANGASSLRTRLMEVAFLAFNVLRPKGRAGWGLSAGILGNGFGLRGEILERIPYDASSIVEDLEYHLRLVMSGEHMDFIDEATVYGEMPIGDHAARVQRSRWEGGRLRMAQERVPQLAAGVLRGEWRLLEPLFELLTLPLVYHVVLVTLVTLLPGVHQIFGVMSLILVAAYVMVSAFLGGQPGKTFIALAAAPFYIGWKMTTLIAVFAASRKNAQWVRTGRDQDAVLKQPAK